MGPDLFQNSAEIDKQMIVKAVNGDTEKNKVYMYSFQQAGVSMSTV